MMNRQIRLLADKAKIDYALMPEIAREPVWIALDDELEKFAQLIIRECMRMCDCADSSYLEHGCDLEASGAAGAKQFIKEWFEVEE
jgi:hypothetical protein